MNDKAIELIEKQIEVDKVQRDNIITRPREKTLEARVRRKIDRRIQVEEYILRLLYQQKKEGEDNG